MKIISLILLMSSIVIEPSLRIAFPSQKENLAFWLAAEDFAHQQVEKGNNIWSAPVYNQLEAHQKQWIDSLSQADSPYLTGHRSAFQWGSNWEFATSLTHELSKNDEAAYDFNLSTSWLSQKGSTGIKEKIQLEFLPAGESQISKIKFFPGNMRTEETWRNYSRPKQVKVSINNAEIAILQLQDEMSCQVFDIPTYTTLDKDKNITITFEILSIYAGDKFNETAISEINFDGTDVL